MEIQTTFGPGDQVWHVWDRPRREVEKCSVCNGAGQVRVVGSDDLIGCPKCWRKGEIETGEQYIEHIVSADPLTVGQVRVYVEGPTYGLPGRTGEVDRSNMGPRSYKRTEEYMCVETGVGSGRIYKLDDLFPPRDAAVTAAAERTQASRDAVRRVVRFDAELRLVDDEVPETLDYATVQQAVQDAIGYTGTVVIDVTEYEHQSSDSRAGDRAANSQSVPE